MGRQTVHPGPQKIRAWAEARRGGPGPAAASRRARAMAGLFCHVTRGEARGQRAGWPTFPLTRPQHPSKAARTSRAGSQLPAPQDRKLTELLVPLADLEARLVLGTTIGVNDHG